MRDHGRISFSNSRVFQRAGCDKLPCRRERIRRCSCFAKDTVNYGDKTECDGAAVRWQGNPSPFWGWARLPRGGWTGRKWGVRNALGKRHRACARTVAAGTWMDCLLRGANFISANAIIQRASPRQVFLIGQEAIPWVPALGPQHLHVWSRLAHG